MVADGAGPPRPPRFGPGSVRVDEPGVDQPGL